MSDFENRLTAFKSRRLTIDQTLKPLTLSITQNWLASSPVKKSKMVSNVYLNVRLNVRIFKWYKSLIFGSSQIEVSGPSSVDPSQYTGKVVNQG